jgi:ABC-type transporter MlaC component
MSRAPAIGRTWRVVDVYLDSIYSELALKCSEYSSVLANEGFDSLIQKIDAKLAALSGK